jgi:serpin B
VACESDLANTPEDAKPIALKASLQKRINQDNAFAFDLLRNTIAKNTDENVTVSPLSVSIALGMAWNGANGATQSEMETTLKMSGLTPDEVNEYYKVMNNALPTIDPTTKLSIANSIWYRKNFVVKPAFLEVNKTNFNAYVRELDFDQLWAKDTINNWCSVKTKGLIPTILEDIPQNAMMYLINAVYFKGIWCNKFDKKLTTESYFYPETGSSVKMNLMQQKDTLPYTTDELADYVDLPYGNKAFSMTVVVPKYGKTTADVLKSMTVEKWNTTISALKEQELQLSLPRFKSENKFLLNDPLIAMGMPLAFTGAADFSRMSNEHLLISKVIHKTYISVDEDGTEVAAVTAIEMIKTSMPMYPIIRADHPFIFVIREKSTGVILFIGKMGKVEKV